MEWIFNNETPIYLQIIDRFKMDIANGSLKPGNKVPSVRELALSAGVNPNTMQKALSELERDGYLESRRTSGRFVADMGNQADSLKNDLAHKLCSEFCEGMSKVGFTPEQSLTVYENYLKISKKEELKWLRKMNIVKSQRNNCSFSFRVRCLISHSRRMAASFCSNTS